MTDNLTLLDVIKIQQGDIDALREELNNVKTTKRN